ncbi:ABC transporter substrate-binding protein [Modicisalibacter luteus]|uniref:ABC transporter substrate-binding protein n=1 Tax=Modicisalibacter luteus TaxID=453962 RepID=UPI003637AE63
MKPVAFLAATLLTLSGTSMAATSVNERVISFDYGSLDTLDALNLGKQVVGVPKQGLPSYLSDYASDRLVDVGGLKTPDLDAIRQASPSLILVTGRQGDQRDTFEAIAPVMEMGVSGRITCKPSTLTSCLWLNAFKPPRKLNRHWIRCTRRLLIHARKSTAPRRY